jgi:hypothetical protein
MDDVKRNLFLLSLPGLELQPLSHPAVALSGLLNIFDE